MVCIDGAMTKGTPRILLAPLLGQERLRSTGGWTDANVPYPIGGGTSVYAFLCLSVTSILLGVCDSPGHAYIHVQVVMVQLS